MKIIAGEEKVKRKIIVDLVTKKNSSIFENKSIFFVVYLLNLE